MNAALIHDRLHIKTFWEKRINNQCEQSESEEQRLQKSALTKYQTTLAPSNAQLSIIHCNSFITHYSFE